MILSAAAKSLQSYPTLCDPIDGSPPGSPVPGILQARTLEWVAVSFSNAWKWKVKVKSLSCIRLLATPWTAAYQAPPSMGFSRQEYWTGVPLPSLDLIWAYANMPGWGGPLWLAISRTKESDGAWCVLNCYCLPGLKLSSVLSFSGAMPSSPLVRNSPSQNLFPENHHETISHQSFDLELISSG